MVIAPNLFFPCEPGINVDRISAKAGQDDLIDPIRQRDEINKNIIRQRLSPLTFLKAG